MIAYKQAVVRPLHERLVGLWCLHCDGLQVDVKALQQQVEEKRARAFEEKQWELEQGACAVEWVSICLIATILYCVAMLIHVTLWLVHVLQTKSGCRTTRLPPD